MFVDRAKLIDSGLHRAAPHRLGLRGELIPALDVACGLALIRVVSGLGLIRLLLVLLR